MYFIAMILRVLCVVSLFWVRGWWVLLVAAGAVILPWFAVMVGNAVAHNGGEAPDAPEPLQIAPGADAGQSSAADQGPPSSTGAEHDSPGSSAPDLIVIDVEPTRRSSAPSEGASE